MSLSSPSADENDAVEESTRVTACETRPGRVVFTVADNSDAWIASNLTVTPKR